MSVPPVRHSPIQRRFDLDDYLTNQTKLTERHAADVMATWRRIRDTAIATGHSENEAEQMADRWLLAGELPV